MCYCITILSTLTWLLLLSLAMREKKRALHIFCVWLIQEIIITKKPSTSILTQLISDSRNGTPVPFPYHPNSVQNKTTKLPLQRILRKSYRYQTTMSWQLLSI